MDSWQSTRDWLIGYTVFLVKHSVYRNVSYLSFRLLMWYLGPHPEPRNLFQQILIPSTSKCGLICKQSLDRDNQVKIRTSGWVLILYNWCSSKKRILDIQRGKTMRKHKELYDWNDASASQGRPRIARS